MLISSSFQRVICWNSQHKGIIEFGGQGYIAAFKYLSLLHAHKKKAVEVYMKAFTNSFYFHKMACFMWNRLFNKGENVEWDVILSIVGGKIIT